MDIGELERMHGPRRREEDALIEAYAQRCIAAVEDALRRPDPSAFRGGALDVTLPPLPEEVLHFRRWREGITRCKRHFKDKGWQVLGGYRGTVITLFARKREVP